MTSSDLDCVRKDRVERPQCNFDCRAREQYSGDGAYAQSTPEQESKGSEQEIDPDADPFDVFPDPAVKDEHCCIDCTHAETTLDVDSQSHADQGDCCNKEYHGSAGARRARYEIRSQDPVDKESHQECVHECTRSQLGSVYKENHHDEEEQAYLQGVIAATDFYAAPTDWGHPLMAGYGADVTNVINTLDGGKYSYNTGSATINGKAIVRGVFPHGACPVLFSDHLNVADWYDPVGKQNIELRIKTGASYSTSGNIQIVATQARTY